MILKEYGTGREIDVHVRGNDPDDVLIESGTYVDTGADAPEDVLDELQQDYASEIVEHWVQGQVARAEAYFEGDR